MVLYSRIRPAFKSRPRGTSQHLRYGAGRQKLNTPYSRPTHTGREVKIGLLGQTYFCAIQILDIERSLAAEVSANRLGFLQEWWIAPSHDSLACTQEHVAGAGYENFPTLLDKFEHGAVGDDSFPERVRQMIASCGDSGKDQTELIWHYRLKYVAGVGTVMSIICGTDTTMTVLDQAAEADLT